jgi:hypothetical protein
LDDIILIIFQSCHSYLELVDNIMLSNMDSIIDIGSSWLMNKWWFKGQILEEVEYIFSQFPRVQLKILLG